MGAEQLLGNGDMLFLSEGGRVTRVHGAFVSDTEVEKIVSHIRKQEKDSNNNKEEWKTLSQKQQR